MSHSIQPVVGAHGSTRNVVGSATISTSAAPSISFMPKPPPDVNTGNTVRCEVSLASMVVVMAQPLSMTASLRRRKTMNPAGDLARHWCCPRRAAAALDVDFHPVDFPAAGRPDAVHGRGALDALRMRRVEEHERLFAARNLFDLLP